MILTLKSIIVLLVLLILLKCCVGLCDEAPSQVRKKRSVAESVSHFTGGYVGLNEIDDLYLNDIDDDTIEISPMEQDLKLKEAELNCTLKRKAALTKPRTPGSCPITWDSILCWPETQVNQSVFIQCPNYVNKFNRKKKASKNCIFNKTTNLVTWSKTNYTFCLQPSEAVASDRSEKKIIEKHMKYIILIRSLGYCISMASLIMSIIILSRKKLRCPRNYVHINLFVSFCLRTIAVMIVDIVRSETDLFKISRNKSTYSHSQRFTICRIIVSIFRYSGSVYTVAITSEAIYLMLLLTFPFYSEEKGFKFFIISCWLLPLIWLVPWISVRIFVQNQWCWQIETFWNLLIEIPHTILTIMNVVCAGFIIYTLYSKMLGKNVNPDKVKKYRRLAKSILILVPIFGLHFIFFEWLPYVRVVQNDDSLLELPLVYIETCFNAFQGLLASIACCFIHEEARIQFLVIMYNFLKKFKCLSLFKWVKCLSYEYIHELKHSHDRRSSVYSRSHSIYDERRKSTDTGAAVPGLLNKTSSLANYSECVDESSGSSRRPLNLRKRSLDESSASSRNCKCCCLFDDHKNDFYSGGHRRSIISFPFDHRNKPPKQSSKRKDFFKHLNSSKSNVNAANSTFEEINMLSRKPTLVMFDDIDNKYDSSQQKKLSNGVNAPNGRQQRRDSILKQTILDADIQAAKKQSPSPSLSSSSASSSSCSNKQPSFSILREPKKQANTPPPNEHLTPESTKP